MRVTAALCALALLVISLAAYSPLHRHELTKPGACTLCQFQHLGAEPATVVVHLPAPSNAVWHDAVFEPRLASRSVTLLVFGRAPPLVPSAS